MVATLVAATLVAFAGWSQREGELSMEAAIAIGAAVGFAAGLFAAWQFRRLWLVPVIDLSTAALRMTADEWEVRIDPHGSEPVQTLGVRLNSLAAHVQKQLAELRNQRADLQRLVDNLPDPILASDGQGRIILINRPAAQLLQLSPAQALRQKVVAVINDESILELFDQVQADRAARAASAAIEREIRLARGGQRLTYHAVAARTTDGGVLLVVRDVSSLATTVQMKTDFVANASHELRTPLSAIKIAFETLREVSSEDPKQVERCMTIVDGHLRRLEDMLQDLLDLSRIESPNIRPQTAPVKPAELFATLKATMLPTARTKGVDLELVESGAPAQFRSDPWLLNVIMKNLVENSIKFTPPGGRVTVRIEPADGNVSLSVADTGIGIAPEHLDRVFERFYQVDTSRSGSAGRGTGLGLAIVKHAVSALSGSVHLDSTLGVGTTVKCVVPAAEEPAADEMAEE